MLKKIRGGGFLPAAAQPHSASADATSSQTAELTSQTGTLADLPLRRQPRRHQDLPTKWRGVIVRVKPGDSKSFPQQAKQALEKMASKPEGARLLDEIAHPPQDKPMPFGYHVCIQPAESRKETGLFLRTRHYTGTNVTRASSDTRASTPGQGAASAIKWNPVMESTPDGSRPSWVGLAHELVHAHRNLHGQSKLIAQATGDLPSKVLDEKEVVGLDGHGQGAITENKIRQEHGIAPRRVYSGLE